MGERIEKLKADNTILAKKIKLILEKICFGDYDCLAKLLSNPEKVRKKPDSLSNRKKSLQNAIKRMGRVGTSQFRENYASYELSRLYFGEEPLFSLEIFLESDLEEFERRLDAYVKSLEKDQYHYIYLFDPPHVSALKESYTKWLHYYEIFYDYKEEKGWQVRIKPPLQKRGVADYRGRIYQKQQQIIVDVSNEKDHLMILFESSLKVSFPNAMFREELFGIAVGISDANQKFPVAKKVLLSKRRLSEEVLGTLYLALNETQALYANENFYILEENGVLDASFIKEYRFFIDALHSFFSHVKYSPYIKTSLVEHMIFTEFHAFEKMYNKFSRSQEFFLHDRKRVYLEFLRFLRFQKEKEAYIVLPIFDPKANVFLYEAYGRKSIRELVLELAREGVRFEILFVIESVKDCLSQKLSSLFSALLDAGVVFGFVPKEVAPLNQYDFFYTQSRRYVVSKNHFLSGENFMIIQNEEYIKNYNATFYKLKDCSLSYKSLQEGSYPVELLPHPLLEKLVGRWYCYIYGSFEDKDAKQMIWQREIEIGADFSVVERKEEKEIQKGEIEIGERQSCVTIFNKITKNSDYFHFNNQMVDRLFLVNVISRQQRNGYDMMAIGLFSREKRSKKEIRHILGESERALLKIEISMQERIKRVLLE